MSAPTPEHLAELRRVIEDLSDAGLLESSPAAAALPDRIAILLARRPGTPMREGDLAVLAGADSIDELRVAIDQLGQRAGVRGWVLAAGPALSPTFEGEREVCATRVKSAALARS